MNRKWYPILLIGALLLLLFLFKTCGNNPDKSPKPVPAVTDNRKKSDPASEKNNRERGFDRRVSYLEYSEHARCRMQCRRISKAEVEEIMQNGKINYAKSDLQNARCPRYAVEGITRDDQRVRIVYAQCNEKTVVVTVIDLETDYTCDCPGDDAKYKNKR